MLMTGKIGMVTGGGSGMGRAAALALAREGAHVVLAGRSEEKLVAVRDEILRSAGQAEIRITDASRREDNEKLVAFVESRFGRLVDQTSVDDDQWRRASA